MCETSQTPKTQHPQGITAGQGRSRAHQLRNSGFFVRECYFTGNQDPYARLKRALKADIDEDAWASLHRTESRPFARPESGRIAVKVINDYGDEVMKVFSV